MSINWAPLAGEFRQDGTKLIFKGSEMEYIPGYPVPAIVNFIADRTFAGGVINAEIKFDSVEKNTGCGIIFYHDTVNGIAVAALGSEALYSIDIYPTWSEPRFVFAGAMASGNILSCSYIDMFTDDSRINIFLSQEGRQLLNLQFDESDLPRFLTKADLVAAVPAQKP